MLYNDELLFLHVPKTAGKSLTLALADTIARPLTCLVPPGTEKLLRKSLDLEGVTVERSNGHENMRKASRVLAERNWHLQVPDFPVVLVAVRNPYDLMVSNYHFMRKTYTDNRDKANFALAHRSDFETYAVESSFFPIDRWLTLPDGAPPNRRLLRFEHLQEDFTSAMTMLGHASPQLPVVNASDHGHYTEYLTPAAEAAIYDKFRYLFDEGFYDRIVLP